MQYIAQKRGYRVLPIIALVAVLALALLVALLPTSAVHNDGLLELDGDVKFDGGDGANPGTATPNPGNQDEITVDAAFDWATIDDTGATVDGVCEPGVDDPATMTVDETNLITEAAKPANVSVSACVVDFVVGSTADVSYHEPSNKDFQEISSDPPNAPEVWGCVALSNATNKADLLNTYFVQAENASGDQILFFGAERDFEKGAVFNGFWFLQDDVTSECPPSTGGNFTGLHVCGDVLVLFNYESGGRVGTVSAYNWQPGLLGCDGESCTPPAGVTGCAGEDGAGLNTCTDGLENGSDGAIDAADSDCTGLGADCPFPDDPQTLDPLCLITTTDTGDCRAAGSIHPVIDPLCGRVNGEVGNDACISHQKPDALCDGPGAFFTPWAPKCAIDGIGDDTNCTDEQLLSPTFSEAGINLSDLDIEIPCISAFKAETRSSPSVTATQKDYSLAPTGVECESNIVTEIHDSSHTDITNTTVYSGTTVHDQATLNLLPASGPDVAAGSTVTINRFDTTDCSGPSVPQVFSVPAGPPGSFPFESSDFPTGPAATPGGGISYNAEYSGDGANYPAATSSGPFPCEPLFVISPGTELNKSLAFSTSVTYTYAEHNDGDVALAPPTPGDLDSFVTDPDCVANGGAVTFTGGDDGDGLLEPSETFTFTCTVVITTPGSLTNTATGHGIEPLGRDVTFCGVAVSGPNDGQFCDDEEQDSTNITITVDQGKP